MSGDPIPSWQWTPFGLTLYSQPQYVSVKPECKHCYCIKTPPSGERTVDHWKCCKCADMVAA